jgi:outer membrane protein assembly factor BamD (BamD/ComL family)
MLSDKVLPPEKLSMAEENIKGGKPIKIPPHIKPFVLAAIKTARTDESNEDRELKASFATWTKLSVVLLILYAVFNQWTHFQWASFRDREESYASFVRRYPSSDFSTHAKERIRVLSEERVWQGVSSANEIFQLRSYKEIYPDGKHLAEADSQIQAIADEQWLKVASTTAKSTVLDFLRDYPETSKKPEAQARLAFIADLKWNDIAETSSKDEVRKFLEDYPETTKRSDAEKRIVQIADDHWKKIATTRSVETIQTFLKEHPESTKRETAEARIESLYSDWNWVREQDSVKAYQGFISRNPRHVERSWAERRIIDLEVKEIAAGDYGEMPPAQPLSIGGSQVDIVIANKTGYELTVRYSGPDSKKLIISVGATQSLSLPAGDYKVAASVSAFRVRNYYGTDTMRGGRYSSTFYIQSNR